LRPKHRHPKSEAPRTNIGARIREFKELGLEFRLGWVIENTLEAIKIEALDINDVILSKLKRFNGDDANDIRAMAEKKLLNHDLLIERFKAAADWFSLDARASDVPKHLNKLRTVERDILGLTPTNIELPPECLPD
jgi:hypothetical protein